MKSGKHDNRLAGFDDLSTKQPAAASTNASLSATATAESPTPTSAAVTSVPPSHRPGRLGLNYHRVFSKAGRHPFEDVEWELRTALISGESGEVVFEQKDVEVPKFWSQLATNVVVSKYFRGAPGTPERERSVKQLVHRVARTIADWGRKDGYFSTDEMAEGFYHDVCFLLVNQYVAFNSPVYFNVGIEDKAQCSACFINSVEDTLDSILELAKTEGMLFKYGSGAGVNLSPIRSSKERLTSGGISSGPVSFMRGYDAFAGVIKSGGKTRRAAKMQILNADHPDILEFVNAKQNEEKKAWALIEQGYDPSFNGEAYGSVFFQNSNFSVRAADDFMKAVEHDALWPLKAVHVKKGEPRPTVTTVRAREIMRKIAEGTHICGDPGMQFHDTINDWNPCLASGQIVASNPCSEYMFLNDTACNLSSFNLMKFKQPGRGFDAETFRKAVRTIIIAMDIIVDNASYPTQKIGQNSFDFRPLGIGYANLGALLMSFGLPYDSDEGRAYAGMITALLTGESYRTSAELAERIGSFKYFDHNRNHFLRVIDKHRTACEDLHRNIQTHKFSSVPANLIEASRNAWKGAYDHGKSHGIRNAQASVLAPTGTIAFMMDCDTTGVEPDIALVKYKRLVGGGMLKIVNQTVPEALRNLGYSEAENAAIQRYIDENETIEGAPHLKPEHLPVFDCAFKARKGVRSIHYMGHLRMMAAAQPFLSGAISKTVNMPTEATVEEIERTYVEAWKLGLKAVAIYRDGSKRTQPLNTSNKKVEGGKKGGSDLSAPVEIVAKPMRRHLPDERESITHKFSIAGHEGYITVGKYPEGMPGEIFVRMAKQGSFVSGLMDAFATATSIMLQYGVPLQVLVEKFSHSRFEPEGMTGNKEIPFAKSVLDYIFRWLALKFLQTDAHGNVLPSSVASTNLPALTAAVSAADAAIREEEEKAGKTTKEIAFHGTHEVEKKGGEKSKTSSGVVLGGLTASGTGNGHGHGNGNGNGNGNGHTHGHAATARDQEKQVARMQADAPPCPSCGFVMVRNGSCYKCVNCGTTSGCS